MKIFKNKFATLLLAAAAFFAVSCDDNDEIKVDPNAAFDAVLEVNEAGPANPNADVIVDASTASSILTKVAFTSTTKNMTRLYITQNIKGQGEEIYKPTENIDLKGDGAVDLTNKNDNTFEFQFLLPVTAGVGTGTVVYKFWTTDGNGDFRDQAKRLAVGPGTITLKYGTAANPVVGTAPVNSYSAKILAAPLHDGTSLTFISLLDGVVYKIKDGAEFAKLWDFGYYNTNAEGASLASAFYYETAFPFVNVDVIAGTTDLNKAYFALTTKTSTDFAAVTKSEDLNYITPSANQKITGLDSGNIIEFVDNYGKKGLIRVTEIRGFFNAGDYIMIDIKVQP
jgi:hypothetical protein